MSRTFLRAFLERGETMLWIFACVVSMALFALWRMARRNTYRAVLNEINLDLKDPLGDNGLSILHLSDLHVERLSISADDLLAKVNGKPIDLIALTGDFLDRVESIEPFLNYLDEIVQLKPRYGVYAVFGNHDYCIEPHLPQLKREMETRGCHVLVNDHHTINVAGKKLNIIGIDDYYSGHSDLARAYRNVGDGVNLVLTHDPTIVLKMHAYNFDYLLSGHFHGGQILYPKAYHLNRMSDLPKKKIIKGLHFYERKAFYISEGLGQTGINIRLRSRPEITVHTLGAVRRAS